MATNNLKQQIKQKNELSTKGGQKTVRELIISMEGEIKRALPSVITPERFTRMALTAVSNTPKLADCTQKSLLGALMNAAQLGLEPNTPLGQAYLIPYGKEVQFQIGYKGLIDLAHRSGEFKTIYAKEVYEADDFHFEYGLEPKLQHVPATVARGDVIYYYAVFTLVNGGFGFEVMSVEDVRTFAKKYSKAFNNGPWQTNFDEMAKKTLIKKVLKYAPIKTDFARNIQEDNTIKKELDPDMSSVQSEWVADDYEVIDEETGEIQQLEEQTPFDDEKDQA